MADLAPNPISLPASLEDNQEYRAESSLTKKRPRVKRPELQSVEVDAGGHDDEPEHRLDVKG